MVKVKQQFFKTAGGIGSDQGLSLSVNCQRVFVTGQVNGNTACDFSGVEKKIIGTSDAFVAGLDHNGNQKFFKHAGRPSSSSFSFGASIISDCDEAFLTGFIRGPTAINFKGCEIDVNITPNGAYGLFVAGVDNCGNQKFFKTAGDVIFSNNFFSFRPKITKNDNCIFVSANFLGPTSVDFKGVGHILNGTNNILVAGLDYCGNQKFFSLAGGTGIDVPFEITANCKGVYVVGAISNSIDLVDFKGMPISTKGISDIFVAGLNNCGKQIFFKHTGTPGQSSVGQSITEYCGQIYITGNIGSGTATNFNNQPVKTYGNEDIFVAGLDDIGNQKFFVTAGSQFGDGDFGISIAANDHGIFVTGAVNGSNVTDFSGVNKPLSGKNDIFVAGLTKCGSQKFFKIAGGAEEDVGFSIVTNNEGVFVTGLIRGPTASDFCGQQLSNLQNSAYIFVSKLDFCGNQQYFLIAGGGSQDNQGYQIVVRDNEIYVTGSMGGTAGYNFKHCPVTTLKGDDDIFVARLDDLCGQKRAKRSTIPFPL